MKKWIIIAVVLLVIFIIYRSLVGTFNTMIAQEENVKQSWSQVENVYQRRADLIPNLVNTVKGYADFEQETLIGVIEARAKATSVTVSPQNLEPGAIQQFQQAQDGLSSALGRLMVVVERYPDLKANQNFLDLQAQLEGTENRIAVERKKYNESVQGYNTFIRKFPNSIIANSSGFDQKGYFEASAGADLVPEVSF